jgi:hypothetical protein
LKDILKNSKNIILEKQWSKGAHVVPNNWLDLSGLLKNMNEKVKFQL